MLKWSEKAKPGFGVTARDGERNVLLVFLTKCIINGNGCAFEWDFVFVVFFFFFLPLVKIRKCE